MQNTCARCQADLKAVTHTMSRFNTETICIPCVKDERLAPGYAKAYEAEVAATRRGDYNFPGVGLSAEDRQFLERLRAGR